MGGPVGPGAKKKNPAKDKKKKKIPRQGDFKAMILFSSLSMSTFSDWMNEKFKSTKQPNTFSYPITNLAWSQPKGPGYQGGFAETIFVDCSSDIANLYESGGSGEEELLVYLSFAISRLKEAIDRRSEDGLRGTVHCTICAYHPVEKLLFALSELLNNSLAYSSVYSSFVGYIKGIDEFRLAFRAIQKDKWKIVVDYCGVFDPYQAIANDKKGDAQRAEEMAKIMEGMPPDPTDDRYKPGYGGFDDGGIGAAVAYNSTGNFSHLDGGYNRDCEIWKAGDPDHRKYENGKRSIVYEGKTYTPDEFKDEFEQLVNPPVEEMNDNLRKMVDSYEKDKQRTNRRKRAAKKAINNRDNTWKHQESIAERDAEYISNHCNRNAEQVSMTLRTLGLGPTNYDPNNDQNNYQNALVPFEGKNMTPQQLENLGKELDAKNEEGLKQIAEYKKAIDSKIAAERERIISESVLGVQIVVAVGSIFFPPLALLDISLTICELLRKPNTSGVDVGMGIAGITFDIIGLIPLFGKPLKMLKMSMTSSELYDAYKLNQLYTNKLVQQATKTTQEFQQSVSSFYESAFELQSLASKTPTSSALSNSVIANHAANASSDVLLSTKIDAAVVEDMGKSIVSESSALNRSAKNAIIDSVTSNNSKIVSDANLSKQIAASQAPELVSLNRQIDDAFAKTFNTGVDAGKNAATVGKDAATVGKDTAAAGKDAAAAGKDTAAAGKDTAAAGKDTAAVNQSKEAVIDSAIDNLDSMFDAIKAPKPKINDTGIVLTAEEDAIHALASELEATIQIDGKATVKTMSLQNADEVITIMKNLSDTDVHALGPMLLNAADGWLYVVGIGYNGICFVNGLLEGVNTQSMTPEEKAMRQQQVNALLEIDEAGKDVAAAREALKNATTDEEREKAQNQLRLAEQHQKEAQGFYDMRYKEEDPVVPSNKIDAEAELKRAREDKKKAEDAYKHAKTAEEQEAALNALDKAEKREQAAQNAVNADFVANTLTNSIDTSGADDALHNWEKEYDNLEAVENRHSVIQNNPDLISALEYQNGLASSSPLDIMNNSELIRGYTNEYNAAMTANQLSGETQYGYDLAVAQSNESNAFDDAVAEGDRYAEVWAAQVNADLANQDLQWTLENIDNNDEE